MNFPFKNQDVAAKYDSDQTADPKIHLPGRKGKGWKGRLSEIPLDQADRWINRPKQNILKLKGTPAIEQKKEVKKKTEE